MMAWFGIMMSLMPVVITMVMIVGMNRGANEHGREGRENKGLQESHEKLEKTEQESPENRCEANADMVNQ